MAEFRNTISSGTRIWARTVGFFEDGSDAGFFLVATHKTDDVEHFCAFSERSGECVCPQIETNPKFEHAPYGREYLFSFDDAEGRKIYLESIG